MEYHVHKAGQRGADTLLKALPDYPAALAWFNDSADAWSIVPAGEREELAQFDNLDSIVPRYGLGKQGMGIFCIGCGDGVSTLGFAYAASRAEEVLHWLAYEQGRPFVPHGPQPGTPEAYAHYRAAMAAGAAYNRETGKRCNVELERSLIGLEGKRVEVTTRDGERTRFIVGKSSGWMPCHLEIKTRRSSGGPAAYIPEGATVRQIA